LSPQEGVRSKNESRGAERGFLSLRGFQSRQIAMAMS
jgi:hypothetical protein